MERLSDIKKFDTFVLANSEISFYYTKETFVNAKGELFQNCNCEKCTSCFRTPNNLKIKIGKLEDVTEVIFEE